MTTSVHDDKEDKPMAAADSKALARRSWEIVSDGNPEALDEVYTADTTLHEPDQDLQGVEGARQYLSMYLSAFPDMSVSVEDVIAEGDRAVTRWTLRGTHGGEVAEFGPPTGKRVQLEGITIHRIDGDKIVEEWERYDNLSVLRQLGLAPGQ
jgi:steroid delta-isomerase-like uncharacterized protein